MVFSVSNFRSQFQFDGARPNLFLIGLTFPINVLNAGASNEKITFMAKAAQVPGSTIGTVPLYYMGREVKVPGNRVFPDWTITVINDEDFLIRNSFENWLNLLNAHAGNFRDPAMVFADQYSTNASVYQYSKAGPETGTIIAQYDFIGLYPNDISPIDLDWQSNDTVEEYSVTLSYQYWTKQLPTPVTDF